MLRPWLIMTWLLLATTCCAIENKTLYVAPDVYNDVAISEPYPAQAKTLFEEAQQAAKQGEPSLALQLASEVLHADPSHAVCRQVLGYERSDNGWITPLQAKHAKRGLEWDSRYGWIKHEDLPRLEAGERLVGKRWVTQEVDAKQHAKIENGWQIRTDHFVVTTNHSLQAGVALAAELENLFQVWRQLFAGYYLSDREISQRFAGERDARKPRRPFKVFYHRDKAGYVDHLKRRQPRIDQTLGIYFDVIREAHFYHSDDPQQAARLRPTLYHEAVHQLFQESALKGRSAGANANFWVVEGVACYFETLVPIGDGTYAIGDGGRLSTAAVQASPMPLAELTVLGQSDLQRRSDLAALYAQSTGVVAMLMQSDREALVAYLQAVYGGRPDGEELARQIGRSYADLDAEYRQFLGKIAD